MPAGVPDFNVAYFRDFERVIGFLFNSVNGWENVQNSSIASDMALCVPSHAHEPCMDLHRHSDLGRSHLVLSQVA